MITCILAVCTLSFIYLLHKIFINSNTQKYYACYASRSLSFFFIVLLVVSELQHIRHNRDKYTREKSHFSLSRFKSKKEREKTRNKSQRKICILFGWRIVAKERAGERVKFGVCMCVQCSGRTKYPEWNIPAEDAWCMDLDEKCWNPFLFPAICQTVLCFSIFPFSPPVLYHCLNLTCTQQRKQHVRIAVNNKASTLIPSE